MSLALVLLATLCALLGVGIARKWYDQLVAEEAREAARRRELLAVKACQMADQRALDAEQAAHRAQRQRLAALVSVSPRRVARDALEDVALPKIYEDEYRESGTLISPRKS